MVPEGQRRKLFFEAVAADAARVLLDRASAVVAAASNVVAAAAAAAAAAAVDVAAAAAAAAAAASAAAARDAAVALATDVGFVQGPPAALAVAVVFAVAVGDGASRRGGRCQHRRGTRTPTLTAANPRG